MTRNGKHLTTFETLEPRMLLSGTSLFSQLAEGAQDISLVPTGSVLYNTEIGQDTQPQLYRFTAAADGLITTTASGLEGLDPMLQLFNSSGRLIKKNLDTSRSTTDSLIKLRVKAGQTYYLMASGEGGESGQVAMEIASQATDDHGDSWEAARLLNLGKRTKLASTGAINFGSDQDVFVFDSNRTAPLNVAVQSTGRGNTLSAQVRIYDADGLLVGEGEDGYVGNDAGLMMQQGQRYYIVVTGAAASTGRYRLNIEASADECGNTFDTALAMGLNSRGSNNLSAAVNYSGDVDVFSLTATVTGVMTVGLNAASRIAPIDCLVQVYDSDGTLIVEDDDGGIGTNSLAQLQVTASELYYIVATEYGDGVGRYALTIRTERPVVPPPPDDSDDPVDPTPSIDEPTDATAGSSVIGRLVTTNGVTQLWVLGTNGADTFTLSQSGATITLTVGASTQSFTGMTSLTIFGFDGDDTLKIDSTVSLSSTVYAGAGDDSIYVAGGVGSIYGGDGNDTIVTLGNGHDTIRGEGGIDSFWCDSTDTLADIASAETAAKTVHRIASFYQPETNTPGAAGYISTTIAGQNLVDPALTSAATGYRNYASTPLFRDGPQFNDIAQGGVGDCFFLASLAGLADTDPEAIRQMITSLGDGTFAVRFFRGGQEVYIRVDADLPITRYGSLAYAKLGPDSELWVALAEKAFSFFRYSQDSYASINGGWMADPLTQITNTSCSSYWVGSSSTALYNYMASALAAGHATTLGSNYSASGPVVGGHAYMVKSVETDQNGMWVTVYNPWGVDGRSYDGNSNDGLLRLSIDTVRQNYSAVVICNA